MSEYTDIIDGIQAYGRNYGLIYTRKCGWIDLGHANPQGASTLYRKVQEANGAGILRRWFFYGQPMRKRIFGSQWWGGLDVGSYYNLDAQLTPDQVKSVALGIFMDVSTMTENFQLSLSRFTDSGFSAEDLVSNVLGFYRAVNPGYPYIALCEPVSLREAQHVWNTYGAVGSNKNMNFRPYLYPTSPGSEQGLVSASLPRFLDTIIPEAPGALYSRLSGPPPFLPKLEHKEAPNYSPWRRRQGPMQSLRPKKLP